VGGAWRLGSQQKLVHSSPYKPMETILGIGQVDPFRRNFLASQISLLALSTGNFRLREMIQQSNHDFL